jgi:hypothetical protein
MVNSKELKKLAAACRKSGIKEFTSPEFSFKLTEMLPITKRHKTTIVSTNDSDVVNEPQLSETDLLFWSTTNQDPPTTSEGNT